MEILAVAFIAAIFLVMWVGRIAGERNRSGAAWMILAVIVGAMGAGLGTVLAGAALQASGPSEGGFFVLSSLLPLLGGMAGLGATAAAAYRRAPLVMSGGARWRVYRIGDARQDGVDATLVLTDEGLRLDPASGDAVTIPRAGLLQACGDGEALRLRWRDGDAERTMALLPTEGPDNRAWRVSQSAAIARRLSAPR
jgi:hypothetical protein